MKLRNARRIAKTEDYAWKTENVNVRKATLAKTVARKLVQRLVGSTQESVMNSAGNAYVALVIQGIIAK